MRRNYSARSIFVFLIFLLCMVPVAAFAANIPAKDGYIQDTARFLNTSELEQLQQAIQDSSSRYMYIRLKA